MEKDPSSNGVLITPMKLRMLWFAGTNKNDLRFTVFRNFFRDEFGIDIAEENASLPLENGQLRLSEAGTEKVADRVKDACIALGEEVFEYCTEKRLQTIEQSDADPYVQAMFAQIDSLEAQHAVLKKALGYKPIELKAGGVFWEKP